MTRGLFITGTGTGVGKTVVTTGLLRLAARHGMRVVGLKPVASGAGRNGPDGELRNADALELQRASAIRLPYDLVNPWCFEPAIAPHLAARESGQTIAALEEWYGRASRDADLALVEGAGGWRVPVSTSGFLSDLPERLGLGVVLVVGLTLGCLSQARLTAEAILAAGRCPLVGWIANHVDPQFDRVEANLETLAWLLEGPPLACIAHAGPDAARSPHGHARVDFPDDPRLLQALGLEARG